jgi:hypothetical protein
MWDLSHPQGPARFEQEAATALAAWRAGRFELPDYYLLAAAAAESDAAESPGEGEQDFYLAPLRASRPHRVVFVPAAEPAAQAAGVLQALGSLCHGPWWPALDDLLETAAPTTRAAWPRPPPAVVPATQAQASAQPAARLRAQPPSHPWPPDREGLSALRSMCGEAFPNAGCWPPPPPARPAGTGSFTFHPLGHLGRCPREEP